jgi:O-antigen/teichoic acid export membrane protein
VAVALFAEGSHQDEALASQVLRSLKVGSFLLLPAVVAMLVVGDKLLLIFGRDYSHATTSVLRVVATSAIPVAVNATYLGIAQVQHRLKPLVLVPAAIAVGTLVLSYALARPLGIVGPAVAWLALQSAVALVVLPSILKMLRSYQDTMGPGTDASVLDLTLRPAHEVRDACPTTTSRTPEVRRLGR